MATSREREGKLEAPAGNRIPVAGVLTPLEVETGVIERIADAGEDDVVERGRLAR